MFSVVRILFQLADSVLSLWTRKTSVHLPWSDKITKMRSAWDASPRKPSRLRMRQLQFICRYDLKRNSRPTLCLEYSAAFWCVVLTNKKPGKPPIDAIRRCGNELQHDDGSCKQSPARPTLHVTVDAAWWIMGSCGGKGSGAVAAWMLLFLAPVALHRYNTRPTSSSLVYTTRR